ncbi:MAG TPA: FHA domain-containing protein [Acidimicrobiales bacterium]|nr:FHA domain-containing protein [Acidimicrobiales bacterium]
MSLLAASSNYAALVRPLQLIIMVIALLFFARVMRVAILEAKPVGDGTRRKRSQALALKYLEPRDLKGERIEADPAVIIGRSADCDVVVNDTYLSSRHARLATDDGELTLEDLGSTNGSYVNQELVRGRVQLRRGDVVQLGGLLFEVVR